MLKFCWLLLLLFFSISQLLLYTVCHFLIFQLLSNLKSEMGYTWLYTRLFVIFHAICRFFLVISLELLFSSFIFIFPFYWHSYNVNIQRIKFNLHRVFGTNANQSLYLTEYICISHHVLSTFLNIFVSL